MKHLFLAWLCIATYLLGACAHEKGGKEAGSVARLRSFFQVAPNPDYAIDGLWLADTQSVANMIEKKFLSGYTAKPDEAQVEQLRQRLKNLNVYFRIENRSVQMLTTVGDSFGVSQGVLPDPARRPGNVDQYALSLHGKGKPVSAELLHMRKSSPDRLEYREAGNVIIASRELRPVEELIRLHMDKLRSSTELPQY